MSQHKVPVPPEPCGNDKCDRCYPLPRWKISTESVRRVVHSRKIKAATAEEARAIYDEGTAWPSSYDERDIEYLEEKPTEVELMPAPDMEFNDRYVCWHSLPSRQAEMDAFMNAPVDDLVSDD